MKIIPEPLQRRRHDFTLTMINIVFLLLLFFLTTGSLTNREEADATVPLTRNLPLERLPRPLVLLEADGSLFLDGLAIQSDELVGAARAAIEATGRADAPLNLLAQRDMAAAPFLNVAETLRAAGFSLQIVTLREPTGSGATTP
ncbi:biopolymer transporter ExbD [Mesorhizobium sp. LHD-90]|uniref:biopolymer transporter ExbD n=1 Tax=Mesorhizobium sp. LHD-90 TaxID=3071414 RepID=UPI0027DF301E|nr:biopolymer transporter ExbD [Mesorhizobium sp. LHD-90]MDQ6434702.1 biopolymer transporter ExbD [Mesorhizobium sp. LHD-90]